MHTRNKGRRGQRGFSLVELVVVVAIIVVIGALALPSIVKSVSDYQLRMNADSLAFMMARARSEAVKANTVYIVKTRTVDGRIQVFTVPDPTLGGGAAEPASTGPQVLLAKDVSAVTSPGSSAISATTAGFTPVAVTTPVRINPRGLPCIPSGTQCVTTDSSNSGKPVGFFLYLADQRTYGGAGLIGVGLTPAGRVRVWSYANGAWKP